MPVLVYRASSEPSRNLRLFHSDNSRGFMTWIDRRIAQAEDSNVIELDLSRWLEPAIDAVNGIHTRLIKLKHLKKLSLAGHNLKEVPAEVLKLNQLTELDLSDNPGILMPSDWSTLSNLEKLVLRNVGHFDGTFLRSLPRLKSLDISFNGLGGLPLEVFRLRKLQELHLDGNMLRAFPRQLHRMRDLRTLSVSEPQNGFAAGDLSGFATNNTLVDLTIEIAKASPALVEISKLQRLESLSANIGHTNGIPHQLFRLNGLRKLEVFCWGEGDYSSLQNLNELQALESFAIYGVPGDLIAPALNKLPALKSLFLGNPGSSQAVETAWTLYQLQQLTLYNCGISSVKSDIKNFKSLTSLGLTLNPIRQLPDEIGELSALETLHLNSTELSSLPSSFEHLKRLRNLWLSSSKVTTVPEAILKLPALEYLDLSSTSISALPPNFANLESLQHLNQ